jgi:hypothetical protein
MSCVQSGCHRAKSRTPPVKRAEIFDRPLNPRPIRLLVEENGGKLWRTVEGKCLLGSAGIDGDLRLGRWAKAAGGNGRDSMVDWFVIQTKGRKFVIYKRPADSAVGSIQICGDLAELETALPVDLFAEASARADRGERSARPSIGVAARRGVR